MSRKAINDCSIYKLQIRKTTQRRLILYASDKLLSYQSANNRSLPTHGTFIFHPWNIHVPPMEHLCSSHGTSVFHERDISVPREETLSHVLFSARRLDIVLFKSQEFWFHPLPCLGKNLADVCLVIGRNDLVATAHTSYQRISEVAFQPFMYRVLSIARERTVTPAHATSKTSQFPPVKHRTMVVAPCLFDDPRVGDGKEESVLLHLAPCVVPKRTFLMAGTLRRVANIVFHF